MTARRGARAALVALVVMVGIAAARRDAWAYPHLQFSSGTAQCRDCHHAAAGGGLLTAWGRDELGDTLSLGGDGAFLHGVELPSWLSLGGDLRVAGLINDNGSTEGAELAVFPMQLEAAARLATGPLSATAVLGLRGAARDAGSDADEAGAFRGAAVMSREHFVTYQPESATWYARAGRFSAPYGLRLADHTAFVRRFVGYGLYEETYGLGAGLFTDQSELHATVFVSDPLQWSVQRAAGAAVLYERRYGDSAVLLSSRGTVGEIDSRVQGGVAGKWWLSDASVLLMAELDGGWQRLSEANTGRPFGAAYAGPTWFPVRATSVSVAAEWYAEDARLVEVGRYAASSTITLFPWAHVELALSGRYQLAGPDVRAAMAMLQLHYFP